MTRAAIESAPGTDKLAELVRKEKWKEALALGAEILKREPGAGLAEGLGRRLLNAKRAKDAVAWLRTAISLWPGRAENHRVLAEALKAEGDLRGAAAEWVVAIEIEPQDTTAHLALADVLMDLGLFDEASTACGFALQVAPDSPDVHERLGRIKEILGDRRGAIECYSRVLDLRTESPKSRGRLALLRIEEGDFESARRLLDEALEVRPKDVESRMLLSRVLTAQGAIDEAIEELRGALALRPRFPEALTNLASLLRQTGQFEEAERCFKKALRQRPDYSIAWNNLANLYIELSRLGEADFAYSRAVQCHRDYAEAHTGRAMLRLLTGRFSEGWLEYEWRWKQHGGNPRQLARPEWRGEPLDGKTILLHAEQGAGDTFQFVRYARVLARQGAKVILHCPESMRDLLGAMPELSAVISGKMTAPEFDVHAPLMSLPRLCGAAESEIPADVPYLSAPPERTAPSPLLRSESPRVGFVWAGNRSHLNDRNRSCPPELLLELAETPRIKAFSLQVGGSRSCAPWCERGSLVDLEPFLNDYGDTAACLEQVDLLITVDTSVAHLAGALARPVWLLLPSCNDWRWLRDRTDSPWYPTVRLFRQTTLGDWRQVLREVAGELNQYVQE